MTGYEVGAGVSVRARHRMPDAPPPEDELHPHDYRIEIVVGREDLDERGMVCDLDVLMRALRDLAESLEDADLDTIRPDWADAVTVEVFARVVHERLAEAVRLGGGETLGVRVYESATEFGGYRSELA